VTLQTDPGWLPERRGKLTASRMADAMSFLKDGKTPSAARRKYMTDLLAERVSDYAVSHYVTPAMERGLALEASARGEYEAVSGNLVEPARLVDHPAIPYFSATPDGFIDHDGLLEIKVPLVPTFIDWRLAGVIPPEHIPQLAAQLLCTRRRWTHFVAYCPEMPEPKRLFVRTFEPTAEYLAEVESAAVRFLDELEAMFEAFTTAAA
jgi:hypothetical protein